MTALKPLPPGQGLALFDIDYTLLTIDSDHAWGQFLVDQGAVDGVEYERKNDHFYALYKAGTLNLLDYLDFSLAPLAAHPRAQLEAWHAQFMQSLIVPAIAQSARDVVAQHQARGDWCAAVTATNEFITAPIAAQFGIETLIGVQLAEANGNFTGKPRGTLSFKEGKVTRVQAWLAQHQRSIESFAESYFYSDSRNDLALLESVSHPVAVNADSVLTGIAQARGWPCIALK